MTIIEQIKAEVENALHILGSGYSEMEMGQISAYGHILSFLSTIESEKPINLEEEINRYLHEECSDDDEPGIHEIAEHFAQWGAEHAREQMMKEAVEGNVIDFLYDDEIDYASAKIVFTTIPKLKEGDKVRVIIVKED